MRNIAIVCMALLAYGCGAEDAEDTVGQQIADDYNAAMDKARAVEDQLQEAQKEIEAALDDQDP